MANQRTLVLVKPDGVQRNLIGKIISYYESQELKIVALKMLTVSRDLIAQHYTADEAYLLSLGQKGIAVGLPLDTAEKQKEYGMGIVTGCRDYLSSGPVIAMILEGDDAIKRVRAITGYTDPATAEKGTIRGDMGIDSIPTANKENRPVYNLIHASGNSEEAEREIELWFPGMQTV